VSAIETDQPEQDYIEQNMHRAVGKRALREFVKYGWMIMLLVSIVLAYLLGVF